MKSPAKHLYTLGPGHKINYFFNQIPCSQYFNKYCRDDSKHNMTFDE